MARDPASGHAGHTAADGRQASAGKPADAHTTAMEHAGPANHDMPEAAAAREPGAQMAMHHEMVQWVDLVLLGLGA